MEYSERLLTGGSWLSRFAHHRRYRKTWNLIRDSKYQLAVDFGCADGWFLKLAHDAGVISRGLGVDSDESSLALCREKFRNVDGFEFVRPHQVPERIQRSCDLAVCTETLEHVASARKSLDQILALCRPGARVIISAPIELGLSLFAKQAGRFVTNKLCGEYGYEPYTLPELIRAGVFWDTTRLNCSHNRTGDAEKGHKGFDYRKLDRLLRDVMAVGGVEYSPAGPLRGVLNTTVYWTCRVR